MRTSSLRQVLLIGWVTVCISMCVATAATAATYIYSGNNFTIVTAPYTTNMSLDLSVTLSSPLGANLSHFNADSSIVSFVATDGIQTLTDAGTFTLSEFLFDTDSAGNIIHWAIEILPASPQFTGIVSCSGQSVASVTSSTCLANVGSGFLTALDGGDSGPGSAANTANAPGQWALVPEPGTALLLGLGLIALSRGDRAGDRAFHGPLE